MSLTTLRTAAITAIVLLSTAVTAPTQKPSPRREPKVEKPSSPDNRLAEWPKLEKKDRDRLLGALKQFRKRQELHAAAHDKLVSIGAAGAPLLFQKVSDRPDNINEELFSVFDEILDARHGALLARQVKKPCAALRRYLTHRLARFGDPRLLPALRGLLDDHDAETAYAAGIGCLALGDAEVLPAVLAYSRSHWNDVRGFTAEALAPARSPKLGNAVFAAIASAPTNLKAAGIRLSRYLATKEQSVVLRGYLGASDHNVKKAAINALRVIHGEKPLEKMTVFQAIERARTWQQRL